MAAPSTAIWKFEKKTPGIEKGNIFVFHKALILSFACQRENGGLSGSNEGRTFKVYEPNAVRSKRY